jgi:CheY-like chemotaxis protein
MARILLAEDDKAVQSFVSRALAHRRHSVTAVDDGLQALEALDQAGFDLLITDIVMPGLDGIALALKVARDHPNLPILMMSRSAWNRSARRPRRSWPRVRPPACPKRPAPARCAGSRPRALPPWIETIQGLTKPPTI